jgi:small subunit ribosomal protein S7e
MKENYGKVLRDCSQALTINPKSAKAYYRSAVALTHLSRFDDAIDCCDRCLEFDADNASVAAVRKKAIDGKQAADRKARESAEREKKAQMQAQALQIALKGRGIILTNKISSDAPYTPHFADPAPPYDTLILPVWLLYPQHGVSDLISHFHEDSAIGDHLDAVFPPGAPPPAFDPSGSQYTSSNIVVYAVTRRKRILKVGRNMTLHRLFDAARPKAGDPPDGLEMKEGCLTLVVVPKGEVERGWVEEAKRARDGVTS